MMQDPKLFFQSVETIPDGELKSLIEEIENYYGYDYEWGDLLADDQTTNRLDELKTEKRRRYLGGRSEPEVTGLPARLAELAMEQLANHLDFGRRVNLEFDKSSGKIGNTISIRKPPRFQVDA